MKNLRGVLLFNAVFIPVLVLCLGVTAYFVQKEFRQLAEEQVLENAHLMMETAKASRNYTTEQIEPLLTHEETRVANGTLITRTKRQRLTRPIRETGLWNGKPTW